jgi:hypothetical protein
VRPIDQPAARRAEFERSLDQVRRSFPLWETTSCSPSPPFTLVRHAALEIGIRLVDRAIVDNRDDVFFLETAETPLANPERSRS